MKHRTGIAKPTLSTLITNACQDKQPHQLKPAPIVQSYCCMIRSTIIMLKLMHEPELKLPLRTAKS
eukprot:6108380-Amphidinium_carterae.1